MEYVKGVLNELFPRFAGIEGQQSWRFGRERTKRDDERKRISSPEMFPAYFRYELPAAIFSAVDFESFVQHSRDLPSDEERSKFFVEELRSMEKGSLIRDDFLKKLSDAVVTEDLQLARSWTLAAVSAANEVSYDLFAPLGESGHILRMVIRFGERLAKGKRPAFLAECMERAADDTITFRILTRPTDPKSDGYLSVSFEELYPAFIQRMRRRYGKNVDAPNVDLSTSDAPSFNLWGASNLPERELQPDPQDREIEYDFWKRYIGQSKARLIRIFNEIFMPSGIYESDPTPFVENKMSVEFIRKLFAELPDDFDRDEVLTKYMNRLRRFLNEDFKNGIGIEQVDDAFVMPGDENIDQT